MQSLVVEYELQDHVMKEMAWPLGGMRLLSYFCLYVTYPATESQIWI